MIYSFFKKTFQDNKKTILWYAVIVILYGVLIVSIFPSIQQSTQQYNKIIESMPPAFIKAFGITSTSLGTLEGYISTEYLSFVWLIIMGILVFSLGGSIVAGEIDKGTSEFSFTLPISRWKIVLGKFVASLLISLIVVLISIISIVIPGYSIGEDFCLEGLLAFFIIASALSFFLLSLAGFLSSIFSSKGRVTAVCSGFFVLSYLLHILTGVSDKFSDFYFLSFFKYYGSPATILLNGSINTTNVLVLLTIGIVFLISSLFITEKRNLR